MGFYDRDYARDRPEPRIPAVVSSHRWTLFVIVSLACAQFVQHVRLPREPAWETSVWLSTEALVHGRVWTLITASCFHHRLLHLVAVGGALAWLGARCEREGRTGWLLAWPCFAVAGRFCFAVATPASRAAL